jgi:hypothetical protein
MGLATAIRGTLIKAMKVAPQCFLAIFDGIRDIFQSIWLCSNRSEEANHMKALNFIGEERHLSTLLAHYYPLCRNGFSRRPPRPPNMLC